ncbi:MAG: efflux RND transporter periplasmic adaptor subunit [Phormidesmis sp.]
MTITSGCSLLPKTAPPAPGRGQGRPDAGGPVAVQTATAKSGSITGTLTYTGTTRPSQQVSLKAQVSGEVLALTVDVGDAIAQNDLLAQLDGALQTTDFNQAQAELSARRAQTAQAQVSIRDAEAAVIQAEATLTQAQIDADRLRQLVAKGAVTQQEAEAAGLAEINALQAVSAAQAQVDAQRQAVASAADQVNAQQAVLAQRQKQLSYTDLRSPLTGTVLSRQVDIGDFVESGDTVLELGDLSTIDVTVQVSELDIAKLRVGQSARVRLDAFPGQGFISGEIKQISPVADGVSRLVPVKVSIPNLDRNIGSGLLARVQFSSGISGAEAQVVVPESALGAAENAEDENAEEGNAAERIRKEGVVFVVAGEGEDAKAIARTVKIGDRASQQVEIISGLVPGETFVVESDRPLTSGQSIRLSILSETSEKALTVPFVQPKQQAKQNPNQERKGQE